jgi:drug/metabolite transporter (DMT)-like permease
MTEEKDLAGLLNSAARASSGIFAHTRMTQAERQNRFTLLLAFGLVYLFWGSTYLAIDIAVMHIPPALACAVRFLIAGPLMLAYCAVSGRRVRVSGGALMRFAIVGVLLLTGGNLTLAWAEQYVASGLAALIVAVIPIWMLVVDSWILRGDRVPARGLAGIGLGVAGVAVLVWPEFSAGGSLGLMPLIASLSLVLGSLSWSVGSVLSRRWDHGGDPFVAGGWEITAAGIANLLIAVATGEPRRVVWTAHGIEAILYLVVFGSWVGYTAYIYLLKHAPTSKVSTYAYVNPVIAVFLGWLVLHESVNRYIVGGTVIIVAAVVLVTTAKVRGRAAMEELPAVEAT